MKTEIRIALVQQKAGEDKKENIKKAVSYIKSAVRKKAKVVCLQELFATPYFPQEENQKFFRLAEPIPGPVSEALSKAAKQNRVYIIGSLFEKRAQGVYHNTVLVFSPKGDVVAKYRKMHIPDDPHFYEKFYFAPGDLGFQAVQTPAGNLGLLICWDQWYPEAARLTALQGAQILFYPTAIGWHKSENNKAKEQQSAAWEIMHRSHAIANGVFVAAVNRVGKEGELTFWGSSFVSDPSGTIIARAGGDKEEVLVADCDLRKIDEWREGWPFLRDRRIDAYGQLTERFISG